MGKQYSTSCGALRTSCKMQENFSEPRIIPRPPSSPLRRRFTCKCPDPVIVPKVVLEVQ